MKFEVFKDKSGDWRWRLKADNGNIVADSAEGYENKIHCIGMIHGIVKFARTTGYPVIEEAKLDD